MASLGLESPGAATGGVTPIFSSDDLFGVVSFGGPVFFLNSPTKKLFSFGCLPLDGVTQGGTPPPPCDATGYLEWSKVINYYTRCLLLLK